MRRIAILLVMMSAALIAGPASATVNGSAKLQWKTLPLISLTITPNYAAGFGPIGGAGSGMTPAPGSGATGQGMGSVDFGKTVQGFAYLYKYAAQATVLTNDLSGFTLYAEGTTQAIGSVSTAPLAQTLFWLPSGSGNSPFSSATPFQATSSPLCGPNCIAYPGSPPVNATIWKYPNETIGQPGNVVMQGYDYQLRTINITTPDVFNVTIVYTAVGN